MGEAAMMRVNRVIRGGTVTDLILLAVFVTLAFVFVQRRGYMKTLQDGSNQSRDGTYQLVEHMRPNTFAGSDATLADSAAQIDERIRKIPDVRSSKCRTQSYNTGNLRVTLVLNFFDYQFYDLKTTMSSIVHHTSLDLIEEIIIVDDGSTLDYIKEDARAFVEKLPVSRLLRLEERRGSSNARMHALEAAKAPIIVFLDTNVICSEGWLEPLISILNNEANTVAIPHYDSINDPVSYEYVKTDDKLATIFSWSYTIRMFIHPDVHDGASYIETPVVRGNALAARTKFFKNLGGFDSGINDPAGESLEISFRTWLCGGKLKILPCSRIGLLSLNDPIGVTSKDSVHRITELWLPTRADYVYKTANIASRPDATAIESVTSRKRDLERSHVQCKNFNWYLDKVAKYVFTPSPNAVYYGLFKCRTGSCARMADDGRLELNGCRAEIFTHPPEMLFEYTKRGTLIVAGKCVTIKDSAYAVAEECRPKDVRQQFIIEGHRFKNVWSQYCLMHVTDPDKKVKKGRQIAMAQECGLDATGQFVEFDFLST